MSSESISAEVALSNAPRHLVVCCDGTNNTLTAGHEDTNVVKLVAYLRQHPSANRLVFYDPGVGTLDVAPPTNPIDMIRRTWDRISGLASGTGVFDNIAQGYIFLMREWRGPQDQIFLFGFSRGAFTARAIAGMVNLFGILKPEHEVLLPVLLRIYFSQSGKSNDRLAKLMSGLQFFFKTTRDTERKNRNATREALGKQIRELFSVEAWVHWIGVWDTVETVGIPGLQKRITSVSTFHDKNIRHVRHALSLDEHRWTFEPRLYAEPGDVDLPGRTLRQRWFPGVHCDVGGSYPQLTAGLSEAALLWMVNEVASELGVPPMAAPDHNHSRQRHDALWDTPWWGLAGMRVRDMQPIVDGIPVKTIMHSAGIDPAQSVWTKRRPIGFVVLAIVLGLLSALSSGGALSTDSWWPLSLDRMCAFVRLASLFAWDQLAALWFDGVLVPSAHPWKLPGQPGWAMFWDLCFIACWGYLVARISSRAFTWLARLPTTESRMPSWRFLGFVPLLAIVGDVCEDGLLLLSLALHSIGLDGVALFALWVGGVASAVKFLSFIVFALLLLPVRAWIAMPWVRRGPAR